MQVIDKGEGVDFKLTLGEVRALRNKRYIIARAGRNLDDDLGKRLIDAADSLAEFELRYAVNTDRLDHEDEAAGIPDEGPPL
jgi:hypothetical protein